MKMDKISKQKIKNLKKEKNYEQIYIEFGSKIYMKYTPFIYRTKDLKKLKKEGKYEDIYLKYGKDKYSNLLNKAMYQEIKEAKGMFKALFWKFNKKLRLFTARTMLVLTATSATMGNFTEEEIKENAVKYETEIQQYNNKILEYAEQVNKMNLNDVQIFMKVMDDMWKNIKGYGNPQKNITGYLELDLDNQDGYGVCRNMASDVAKKLNAINPNYNARIIPVYVGKDGSYQIANIKIKKLETNDTVLDEEKRDEEKADETISEKVITKIFGNHMVTLVDVKEDNLTIVLDPTNPGLGIYKNGNIKMLNSKGLKFEAKEYSEAIIVKGGIDGFLDVTKDYLKSFGLSNIDENQIKEKYGIEAQNKALEEVRKKENQKKYFKESIKINANQEKRAEESDKNIINNIEKKLLEEK